ncbi:MAG: hypothetical protein ACNA8W_05925 [Bradymonadaceae bacterium]
MPVFSPSTDRLWPIFTALLIVSTGCHPPSSPATQEPAPQAASEVDEEVSYRWLPPLDAEKFAAIEEQLQGFSRTMREVGYRYNELYWAGEDENWEYAEYQLEHIAEAIEQGIIRRPGRAANSRPFLDEDIPALEEAIERESAELFEERFQRLTMACNTCHGLEDVAFIPVRTPTIRVVPAGDAPSP